MQSTPMGGNSGWTVTSQQEATDTADNGQFVPGYRIYFRTNAGHSGSVFVPRTQYTVEAVRTIIATHADQLDQIGSLSEG